MDDLPIISLRPSRRATALIALVTACALLALVISGLSPGLKLSVALLALALGLREYQCALRVKFTGLGCARGQWWVMRGKHKRDAVLCGEQLVLPWLVVLQFRTSAESGGWRSHSLAIWSDSASAEDHRRLRVALRFGRRQ